MAGVGLADPFSDCNCNCLRTANGAQRTMEGNTPTRPKSSTHRSGPDCWCVFANNTRVVLTLRCVGLTLYVGYWYFFTFTTESIASLDFGALVRSGYSGIVFDKDNCLVGFIPYGSPIKAHLTHLWFSPQRRSPSKTPSHRSSRYFRRVAFPRPLICLYRTDGRNARPRLVHRMSS